MTSHNSPSVIHTTGLGDQRQHMLSEGVSTLVWDDRGQSSMPSIVIDSHIAPLHKHPETDMSHHSSVYARGGGKSGQSEIHGCMYSKL